MRRRTPICLWLSCFVMSFLLFLFQALEVRFVIWSAVLAWNWIHLFDVLWQHWSFRFLCNTHAKWALKLNATDGKDDYDAAAVAGCDGGKSDLGSCPHPPDFGHSWCCCVQARVQRRSSLWGKRKFRTELCLAMSRRRWLCGFHLYVIDVT